MNKLMIGVAMALLVVAANGAESPMIEATGTCDLPGNFFLSFCSSRDLLMLDNKGTVVWSKHEEQPEGRKQEVTGFWDFKRHVIGGKTYYSYHDNTGTYDNYALDGFAPGERVILDEYLREIKRITFEKSETVEKGHPLDGHDFLMIDLDHYILSGYLTNTVYNVPSRWGEPSRVVYSYLQEVKDGKVVWEWKSTDYPKDPYDDEYNLYGMTVTNACPYADDFANEHTTVPDYVHFNSMQLNAGGDLVCSFRHLDAIICLDRSAKEDQIRWILSGNEFGLPDEIMTSAQHYATVEGDDKITVFDNGNGRDPQQTRIMRYSINTNEMTATPETLYEPTDKFSAACGSVQVLEGNKLVIGWGKATKDQDCLSVVDISSNPKTLFNVKLLDENAFTYRAVYCPGIYTPPPEGSIFNPWKIGAEGHEEEVSAWTNGIGGLTVEGTGAVGSTPWEWDADGITRLVKAEGVTGLESVMATLPDLANVNGLTLGELASAGMLGAVKATGFSAIAVTNGVATLSVVIGKADSLDKPEWKPVSTNDVPVKADTPAGFFIVAPAVPSDLDLPPIVTVK